MKIVTVSQMQQAEHDCAQFGISTSDLMEKAGKAIAEEVRITVGDLRNHNILVLVGPGNNGGDGLVAARYLFDWGTGRIKIYLCTGRPESDANFGEIKKRGIHFRDAAEDNNLSKLNEWLSEATVVLDSVFGTGKSRPLAGVFAQILGSVRDAKLHRPGLCMIAVDLPSGTDADTGFIDPHTPQFDQTITLGYPKIGIFNYPAMAKAGKITVVDIGIPTSVTTGISTELLTASQVVALLPRRPLVSHKGTYGKVLVLAGSINYSGAAYLACSAAMRVGAGLTTLAIGKSLLPILAAKLTEVTYQPLPESDGGPAPQESIGLIQSLLPQYNTFLIGCGIGQGKTMTDIVKKLILETGGLQPTVVVDADGVNILSGIISWEQRFKNDAVFTPHPAEMSRLVGKTTAEIQAHRMEFAREAAIRWHKTIVLKGAYTVIASADGRLRISPFANAGLSSAGTGDVLAGTIAGMLAQGLSLFDAASCGVYLHGLAGEMVKADMGDAGMLAQDLLPLLPKAIRQLKEG
jgi:ADP-dependent NAD(P)H-hydrate dehydratase / NAD(P)H-hydrate epimerase